MRAEDALLGDEACSFEFKACERSGVCLVADQFCPRRELSGRAACVPSRGHPAPIAVDAGLYLRQDRAVTNGLEEMPKPTLRREVFVYR